MIEKGVGSDYKPPKLSFEKRPDAENALMFSQFFYVDPIADIYPVMPEPEKTRLVVLHEDTAELCLGFNNKKIVGIDMDTQILHSSEFRVVKSGAHEEGHSIQYQTRFLWFMEMVKSYDSNNMEVYKKHTLERDLDPVLVKLLNDFGFKKKNPTAYVNEAIATIENAAIAFARALPLMFH